MPSSTRSQAQQAATELLRRWLVSHTDQLQRDGLLARAFRGARWDHRDRLQVQGAPKDLAVHWREALWMADCIDGNHPLGLLLRTALEGDREPSCGFDGGFQGLLAFLDEQCRALPDGRPSDPRHAICPYRGLLAFREEDAAFFRGREEFTERLAEAVVSRNLVAVVGASGSGKSSVVYAGLLHALRQFCSGRPWEILTITPGARPLHALMAAFSPPPPDSSRAQRIAHIERDVGLLREQDLGLRPFVDDMLGERSERERLLLFVDQWEELYTQCDQQTERADFLRLLLDATTEARLTLVLTLRGDFLRPGLGGQNPR
jgi:hypothetical protein